QLCDRAALSGDDGRYHGALLRGDILLELGDAAAALSAYETVAQLDVPDPELDCARGIALFHLCRLPEAENALRSALRGRPDLPHAWYTLALIAEIRGNGQDPELFRRARMLDPEHYPPLEQMGRGEFEQALEE